MASCGEVLAHMLEAYGIDTVFGIPGTHTIELYRGLPQTKIRHITPRHEQGAGYAADGYARISGKPAACFTVSGPGAYNIAASMGQALADSVPMLVISADNNSYEKGLGEGRLHETRNLQAAMAECSRWSHTLMRADELPKVLARAFSIFESERPGPVHLCVPLDVITSMADHVDTDLWTIPSRPAPCPSAIASAAYLLNQALRPVIAIGGGAIDAAQEVKELAARLNAPVTSTHNAKGIMDKENSLHVGGNPSYDPIRKLYDQADVILGVGTEFGETDYDFFFNGDFNIASKVIRIDIDSGQLCRNVRPEIAIQSDAKLALAALLEKVTEAPENRVSGEAVVEQVKNDMLRHTNSDYQTFLDVIQEALPGAILLADSTQPAYFAAAQYDAPAPRTFASAATGYGTLGYALPAAIGAKLANPEAPVIALLGDGGIQFSINELSSAIEANTPIIVLLWNNSCYGQIASNFKDAGMNPIGCDIHTPNFLGVAEAYGCKAIQAKNHKELFECLNKAQHISAPFIIEVDEKDFIAS